MRLRAACSLLLAACSAAGADDSRLPPGSRARAERTARWTAELDHAATAAQAGRLEEAEATYVRILEATETAGDEGLPQARAVDGLADIRRVQGRPAEATALYERAAGLWERVLGPTPQPRLAITLHNLGLVRLAAGRAIDARAPLERALRIWEATIGAASAEAEATRRALAAVDHEAAAAIGTR